MTPVALQAETIDESPAVEQNEFQLSETEKQRWIWTFERLKNADIDLSFSERVKFFCEASTPEEVDRMIHEQLEDHNIIPLAA